jgi:translocation and assembly module TamA
MDRALLFLAFVLLSVTALPARGGIDVHIRGLGSDESDNAYAQIAILNYAKQIDSEHGVYDPVDVQRLFEQGESDIRKSLQPFGWYNPVIHSKLSGQAPDWLVEYDVDAGPMTTIGHLDVQINGEGKDSAAIGKAVEHLPLHPGERLKHPDYEAAKRVLLQAAQADGYLDAVLSTRELRVDVAANSADIQLTLDSGPRYYFGSIAIVQSTNLHDDFLRRYVTIKPDQPFDPAQLLATQFALTDLDYFRLVEVDPQKEQADPHHRVPVVIHLTAKAPRTYKFGAGYGTDTGARALAGAQFRRINDAGHKLDVELRPSQKISSAIAEYSIPVGNRPGDTLGFNIQGLQQDVQAINEHVYSIGTRYNRVFTHWQQTDYLSYTRDNFAFTGESETISRLLIPGVSISHTDVDDPIYPRRGWYGFVDLHGATQAILSDSTFIQSLVRVKTVFPLGPSTRVLLRGEEGASFVSSFSQFPASQRFFAGGDESVRGYAYKSLGPRDSYGNVIGGKYLTTASLEIDQDVYRNYGIAAFIDAGGADDSAAVLMHEGAGLGLRYRAPFGSIAIDLAHPFDTGESPVRLHVSVRVGL